MAIEIVDDLSIKKIVDFSIAMCKKKVIILFLVPL